MGSLANDNHVLPSTGASRSLPPSHSQDQGQRVIVLTEENFFETLDDLFLSGYGIADTHDSNAGEAGRTRTWLNDESDREDDEDDESSDPDHPDKRHKDPVLRLRFPDVTSRAIYHVMQLGAPKKALNPWFKAFLASVIATSPDVSTDDLQDSWFDQTEEERNLEYIWDIAGRPHDEGFAAGFKLPEGNDSAADTDDPTYGVDFLMQVDSEDGSNHPIAINKDADTGVSALTSPDLRLPDSFDFLSQEALDELAAALMDRIKIKMTKGLEPSDFTTPRSSATHKPSTSVPKRPSHTVHAADRKILPLPGSSAFNSDLPLPSSPSPHDRQRDRDGFAIPSHPASHRVISPQGRTLNLATDVPKSASSSATAQRSQPRQPPARRVQPSDPALKAFLLADQANRTPQPRKPRDSSRARESPADRGREPKAAAPSRLHEPRDQFAAASDIPSRPRSPRPRAHSVVGVTRAHGPASDSEATPTPRASGSGTRTGSTPQQSDDKLDFGSESLTSDAGPSDAQPPRVPLDPHWIPYPKSTRGPFRRYSTSRVVQITMRTKFGAKKKKKNRQEQKQESKQEQEQEQGKSGDRPQGEGDEGGLKDGKPRAKGKGRADRKGT
ncbi:hypothetical protein GSI_09195 [Ganoderma sinense ZZ0214-1]|uniref:Uncharacterized protein n=1 Tax=Ganoderma sinense ZZ0214-1 TaxID=1077348 RepID=A0A2G8S5U6_9APHY|nr:hypothetical protein GSI_09195 [Ganoderma sinense ZZ0214-1]